MKKTGEISSALHRGDQEVPRQAGVYRFYVLDVFGGLVSVVGVLGIINNVVVSLGAWNLIESPFLERFSAVSAKARRKFI